MSSVTGIADIMTTRSIGTILFLGLFGIALIYTGIRRLLDSRKEPGKLEPLFWGTVGIALGAGCFVAGWWFTHPLPPGQG